jgi:hypothetical protein
MNESLVDQVIAILARYNIINRYVSGFEVEPAAREIVEAIEKQFRETVSQTTETVSSDVAPPEMVRAAISVAPPEMVRAAISVADMVTEWCAGGKELKAVSARLIILARLSRFWPRDNRAPKRFRETVSQRSYKGYAR